MMFWSRDTFLTSVVTVIVADFSVLGTKPSHSDRLTILLRIWANGSMSCLIIVVGIGSKPHDFEFDFCAIFLISSTFDLRLLILSKKYLLKVFAKPLAEVWTGRGRSQFLCKTWSTNVNSGSASLMFSATSPSSQHCQPVPPPSGPNLTV